jgi:hypothetical protein
MARAGILKMDAYFKLFKGSSSEIFILNQFTHIALILVITHSPNL